MSLQFIQSDNGAFSLTLMNDIRPGVKQYIRNGIHPSLDSQFFPVGVTSAETESHLELWDGNEMDLRRLYRLPDEEQLGGPHRLQDAQRQEKGAFLRIKNHPGL